MMTDVESNDIEAMLIRFVAAVACLTVVVIAFKEYWRVCFGSHHHHRHRQQQKQQN